MQDSGSQPGWSKSKRSRWSGIMRKFLMATDLSPRSDRALERAVMLAREHDARLTIVHVVDEVLIP